LAINRDKPDRWKADIAHSVDFYNQWFMKFAPAAYRKERIAATKAVEDALRWTNNLTNVGSDLLRTYPGILPALRMCTCPPIARDRLIGLSGVRRGLVGLMEKSQKLPRNANAAILAKELEKIGAIFERMADPDIFTWLQSHTKPRRSEVHRAATIVADRLCGAAADPIIRNAQEARQLEVLGNWLKRRGYKPLPAKHRPERRSDGTPPCRVARKKYRLGKIACVRRLLLRLCVKEIKNLAGALGADARNLAKVGHRGPLDFLQRSKMVEQRTFT